MTCTRHKTTLLKDVLAHLVSKEHPLFYHHIALHGQLVVESVETTVLDDA